MDENNVYETANEGAQPPVKEKKKHTAAKIIALALVCAILGGLAGAGLVLAIGNNGRLDPSKSNTFVGDREVTVVNPVKVDSSAVLTDAQIYTTNVNSTVGIRTSITTTNFWGYSTTSAASGSGFVYTDDGYIITNYHVVEGSDSITVSTFDGEEHDALLVGYDESNDVAVLKIEAEGLVPVVIGDSDKINIGDHVVAIGNPLGELTFSLTQGAVSSLNRNITLSNGTAMNLIQTDCAINSGNSGGALFNDHGEVIGITNAKYSSSSSGASIDNIGFAIPIDSVLPIVRDIIEKGYVSKPYIGISVGTVSEEATKYGLPAGASVQDVVSDSPAEKAGLELNDIITAANGTEIKSGNDLVSFIRGCAPGDEIELTIYRSGETMTVAITVGERQQSVTDAGGEDSAAPQQPMTQLPQGSWGDFGSLFPFFFQH